jgi:prepilin-type N-terminal cleavage/methylation domain-containing protein
MKKYWCQSKRFEGYTLIEMLVVVAILSIIIPTLYVVILNLYKTHGRTFARATVVSDALHGLQVITGDIRSAAFAENGSLPIVSIGTSTITFYVDTDLDGRVDRVQYTLTDTTITKGVVKPTASSSYPVEDEVVSVLSSYVGNNLAGIDLFTFYSANGDLITSQSQAADIRRVQVEYVAQVQYSGAIDLIHLRSSASIRNLKDNH